MKNNMDIYGRYYKPYYDNYNCQTGTKNFYVSSNDNNVKVDCVVDNKKGLKVYGKAIYKNHKPCVNAVVILYKYENNCSQNMVFVKKTHTDCYGRYEFDLVYKQNGKYVIKVEVCNDNFGYYNDCNCGCGQGFNYNNECGCHNGCHHNDHHHHDHHDHHNHHNHCYDREVDVYYEDAYSNNYFYNYNYNYEASACDYDEYIGNTINSYRNNYIRKNRQCDNNCLYY